jgi:hypothetical protein
MGGNRRQTILPDILKQTHANAFEQQMSKNMALCAISTHFF